MTSKSEALRASAHCSDTACVEDSSHPRSNSSRLVAILASPPSATSGARTRARLALAADVIGSAELGLVNLLDVATRDVLEISRAGQHAAVWLASRPAIEAQLSTADHALLAWGTTEPTGPARFHHRAQIEWVMDAISRHQVSYWTVGGAPRHPSRWQRYTARAFPDRDFRCALPHALTESAA